MSSQAPYPSPALSFTARPRAPASSTRYHRARGWAPGCAAGRQLQQRACACCVFRLFTWSLLGRALKVYEVERIDLAFLERVVVADFRGHISTGAPAE